MRRRTLQPSDIMLGTRLALGAGKERGPMTLFTLLAKRQRALADHGWMSILVVATAVVLGSQACTRSTLSSGSAPDAAAGASVGVATGGAHATGGAGGTEASATGGSSASAGNGGPGGPGGGDGEAKPDAASTTATAGAWS